MGMFKAEYQLLWRCRWLQWGVLFSQFKKNVQHSGSLLISWRRHRWAFGSENTIKIEKLVQTSLMSHSDKKHVYYYFNTLLQKTTSPDIFNQEVTESLECMGKKLQKQGLKTWNMIKCWSDDHVCVREGSKRTLNKFLILNVYTPTQLNFSITLLFGCLWRNCMRTYFCRQFRNFLWRSAVVSWLAQCPTVKRS